MHNAQTGKGLPMASPDNLLAPLTPGALAPLTLVRSEVNFLVYPFFCLDNRWHKDRLNIEYHRRLDRGEGQEDISWRVLAHQEYGLPGPFDWALHQAIEAIINERGFPVQNPIPFSMRELCRRMAITYSGRTAEAIKAAFLRITATVVESKRTFYSKPKKQWLDDTFHLYDRVVYRGEERHGDDGRANTNYLYLGSWYLDNLNALYVTLLDSGYRQSLAATLARRLYEILGVKFYGLRHAPAPGLRYTYSTLCALLPVKRYRYLSDAHRQLDPAHAELLATGFLAQVAWHPAPGTPSEWSLQYFPGPRVQAAAAALPTPPDTADMLDLEELVPAPSRAPTGESAATSPIADEALTTQAHALVQHFHQRFHGTPDVTPSARELTQARALLAQDGLEHARHLVDFSYTAAQETAYRPQTFGGILQYSARARVAYAQAQEREAAAARAREERRRAQEDERLRRQYDEERAQRLAELRATTPPDVLDALEQAAAAHFERNTRNPFGRDLLRRLAIDEALAAHFQLPNFAAWQATPGPG